MSPLAKSYLDPETGHLLSARAELFVNGTEYINMYEEENDPFAQTKKFLLQQSDGAVDFDAPHEALVQLLTPGQRYYVKVLEMGLPPTAGWGCGIERFTMLFGGAQRIGDVLPFGTLRNVVAMGTGKGSEN
jgi:lysyl-tRNA synthetase class 2